MRRISDSLKNYEWQELDPISNLAPITGNLTFYKQMVNDPVVGGILFHFRALLSQVKWIQSKEVFDNETLQKIIDDFFFSIVCGFYAGEILWRKNKLVDIVPIHPTSVSEIDEKFVYQNTAKQIPRKKCVVFSLFSEGRNYYGISILRHVYKPWYLKSLVENHDIVALERQLRGLPVITAPEGVNFANAVSNSPGYDPMLADTISMMTEIVRNIYDGKQKGAVLPHGWELSIKGNDVKTDTAERLKHYRTDICIGLLDSFIASATVKGASGSDVFVDAINFYVNKYKMALNDVVAPFVKRLNGVDVEFDAFLRRSYDLNGLASFLTRLGKNEMIYIDDDIKRKNAMLAGLLG